MGRPNQLHDRLDALLDGRPGEVTDDLAPLLAAAEAMRAELADIELDPQVVDRHLEQVLDRPATVVTLPVRTGSGGALRRRVAAAALAAALVLVPATAASAASASALPGQALYPVKRAVEQFRLAAVQWSAAREAHERTRLAATRLRELDKLVERQMFEQVPPAIRRLDKAVVAARAAVEDAREEGTDRSDLAAVVHKLGEVQVAQRDELVALRTMVKLLPANLLPTASRQEIVAAVEDSPAINQPPLVTPTIPPISPTIPPDTGGPPSTEAPTEPPGVPSTQPEPPTTTTPPPSEPPSTEPPPTEPPPTTAAPAEGSTADVGSYAGTPTSTVPS